MVYPRSLCDFVLTGRQPFFADGDRWKKHPSGFSPYSPFELQYATSPARALSLIREQSLHLKLGDFDDHLERVSVDWLQNDQCRDVAFKG